MGTEERVVWQSTKAIHYGEAEGCLELVYPVDGDRFRLQIGDTVVPPRNVHAHVMGDVGRLKNMIEALVSSMAEASTAAATIDQISRASH